MITAEYNGEGYVVNTDQNGGEQLYSAGNCPTESTAVVPLDRGLPLKTIRKFAIQTAKEIAEERGEPYGYAVHV